jgi:H+/Cl- antiporter ClcA
VRRESFASSIANAVLLGIVTGLFGTVFLWIVEKGTHLLWAEEVGTSEWFSAPLPVFVIPVVAGLGVGLIYRVLHLPPRFKGFIEELQEGEVEPRTAPGVLLVAVLSLIGGSSLGPEGPLGTGGGAAGTWLGRRRGLDEESIRTTTFAGMSAVFGGLVSSPLAGPLLAFELEHEQTRSYYFRHLIPGVVAGGVGFAVMYPLIGAPFLGQYEFARVEFRSWMLLAAVGVGLAGALTAWIVGLLMVHTVNLLRRLDGRPVVRGLLGGLVVAGIGFALPLTLFSGQTQLARLLDNQATIGIATLVALIVLKAVTLGASLGGGFYGGPIFPMFFIGGALGVLLHQLVPELPMSLAVAGAMAALGGALALIPISITILASVLVGADFLMAGAILICAATGFSVRYALSTRAPNGDVQTAARADEASPG